jgi:hypothetical protein
MAGMIVPVLAIAAIAAMMLGKKKKPGETPAMSDIEGADKQMGALYSRLMDPTKTNLTELTEGARILQGNGYHEWAGNLYAKISSIQAQAQTTAQSAGAAQAAAVEAQEAAKKAGELKAEAAKKEWEQAAGGRPSDNVLTETYLAAMKPDMADVGQLQYAAAVLQAYGKTNEAAQVRAKIAKLQADGTADAGTKVDAVKPGGQPVVLDETGIGTTPATIEAGDEDEGGREETSEATPAEEEPPALAQEETTPQADPIGTIKLARNLIAAEESSNWKTSLQPDIKSWQTKAGLTSDGKFGPKSALRMGEEVGILPRVRYWSKTGGTKSQQLERYRSDLNALADKLEAKDPKMQAHASALRISAVNEDGAGYPASPKKDSDATARAKRAAETVAETEGDAAEAAKLKELLKLGPQGLAEYYASRQAKREEATREFG